MAQLNPESRRRAEEAASQVIDAAEPEPARAPGHADVAPQVPADPAARALYLRHLFVHGLMESLADEGRGIAVAARDRRVTGVMAGINADRAAGRVVRPRAGWRRLVRPLAAAAAVLLVVVGAFAIFSGGGLEARAAVRFALDRVDDGLDRMYRGKLTLGFGKGTGTIQRVFRSEFVSRGRDRFLAMMELPFGPMGGVPVHMGRVGDAAWYDSPLTGPVRAGEEGSLFPMPMGGRSSPLEMMTNLGSLLEMMEQHCELSWETEDAGGPLRVVGTPVARSGEAGRHGPFMHRLERVLVEVDRTSHEVRSIQVQMVPRDETAETAETAEMGEWMSRMLGAPAGARLASIVMRLEYVKSYKAPDDTYWPEELGDPEDDG